MKYLALLPFLLAVGCQPLLLSMAFPGLPSVPNQLTPDQEEAHLTEVSYIIVWLQELESHHIG